jgi:hypothetical protein
VHRVTDQQRKEPMMITVLATAARRALALTLAGTLLSAGAALAGNGAETTHFTVAYASFTCTGERIVKVAPNPFTKDSETCTYTDLSEFDPPGTYAIPPMFWVSDYEIGYVARGSPTCDSFPQYPDVCIRVAVSGNIVVIDNGDGTGTLQITAYY